VLSDRAHFNLRKLHSLTGIVPIGVFLLEHLFTNSFAIFGPEEFNEKVVFLTSLPYLYLIEICFIFVPIAFHAILGVVIATSARYNVGTLGYGRNWAYFFQRISGFFLLVFITVHVVKTRFSGAPPDRMFQHMAGYLPDPLWFTFYALGVVAAAYHFGNGLFTFAISWGITIGKRSQRAWSIACVGIFLALSFVGVRALYAFVAPTEAREKQLIFEHPRSDGARGEHPRSSESLGRSPRGQSSEAGRAALTEPQAPGHDAAEPQAADQGAADPRSVSSRGAAAATAGGER